MTSPRPPGRTWLRAAPAGRLRQGHVRRWRWRHCNVSPPRSEMFDSNRRTRAERPSIPASGLLPCVTEDRCRSFCRPTWRRSEDEFATISITSSPVSGRISGPKSAVFPGLQPGTEGMFRVGKTKVQTAAKKLRARFGGAPHNRRPRLFSRHRTERQTCCRESGSPQSPTRKKEPLQACSLRAMN